MKKCTECPTMIDDNEPWDMCAECEHKAQEEMHRYFEGLEYEKQERATARSEGRIPGRYK